MPQFLQEIIDVNPEDEGQFQAYLVPLFSKNYAVVNFYLSSVVFPREAKQFPKRLAASAWDLAEKNHLVTGFSGTNDNRDLLPTSIEQLDPLEQLGTNAKVLSYLLQPENDYYVVLYGEGHSIGSHDILQRLVSQKPPVRVLLDVGAQMLDMQTTEIVSTWLSLSEDIEAIVFFDDQDKLVIMSQDGVIESFKSSQFSQKLDVCAVYLDDTHTRGTDLNLPKNFRAAVTLGPHLNKDRLVQGRPLQHCYLLYTETKFFVPRLYENEKIRPWPVARLLCSTRSRSGYPDIGWIRPRWTFRHRTMGNDRDLQLCPASSCPLGTARC